MAVQIAQKRGCVPFATVSNDPAARRLELPSKVVAVLALRRLYEDVPFGLTHVYLPPELGQRLAEADALPVKGPGTVIGALERFLPRPIAGANQVITSVPAPRTWHRSSTTRTAGLVCARSAPTSTRGNPDRAGHELLQPQPLHLPDPDAPQDDVSYAS